MVRFDVVTRGILGVMIFIYFNKLDFYDLCMMSYTIDMHFFLFFFFCSEDSMAQQIRNTESMT